jgi:hypothetical protein
MKFEIEIPQELHDAVQQHLAHPSQRVEVPGPEPNTTIRKPRFASVDEYVQSVVSQGLQNFAQSSPTVARLRKELEDKQRELAEASVPAIRVTKI